MNTLNTHHRGTQSHASGAENRDTYTHPVSYQKFIATTAEHQTMVRKHAKGMATPTTVHQTAIAEMGSPPNIIPTTARHEQTVCTYKKQHSSTVSHTR